MPDDLGFAVPASRRDLTALRGALEDLHPGAAVTATFRVAEHGRFAVSGRARTDPTTGVATVGWWDLTTGKGTDPVAELQSLEPASTTGTTGTDGGAGTLPPGAPDADDLRAAIADLGAGDVVTAAFDFEGCGPFTIAGGVRRDESGTRWVVAGHHLTLGGSPAARLRRLVVERTAAPSPAGPSAPA